MSLVPLPPAIERKWVSRFSSPVLGLQVHKGGVLADADFNDMLVTMTNEANGEVIFERQANHPSTGVYEIVPSSVETQIISFYEMKWTYAVDGIPQIFIANLHVGQNYAAYDNLNPELQDVIEGTWALFSDMFDSVEGGPNLQDYYQTRFNRGTFVVLMQNALDNINLYGQPKTTFTLDPTSNPFPYQRWPGLIDQALYIEVIRHLVRSYVEQPVLEGGSGIARLDRRDYFDRWQSVLELEQRDFDRAVETFKIAQMGLGQASVLISGGVYGNFAPTRMAGSVAARPRYWARFY
jgi:hypothetical protein